MWWLNASSEHDPVIVYCYDAYCGYVTDSARLFPVFITNYKDRISFKPCLADDPPAESAQHIGRIASFINDAYVWWNRSPEFNLGEDYLWHIKNPERVTSLSII
jgi:putative protein-disulfide isomerase